MALSRGTEDELVPTQEHIEAKNREKEWLEQQKQSSNQLKSRCA